MKSGKGFEQSYNVQVATDRDTHLIVATDVSNQGADVKHLVTVLDRVQGNTGRHPERVLADAGYRSEENFRKLEERGIDGYVAIGRGEKTATKVSGEGYQATQRMTRKMKTKRGKSRYRERKWIAEAPFGWIKSAIGFRQFSVRGLRKVAGEFSLVALVANLRRMNKLIEWI